MTLEQNSPNHEPEYDRIQFINDYLQLGFVRNPEKALTSSDMDNLSRHFSYAELTKILLDNESERVRDVINTVLFTIPDKNEGSSHQNIENRRTQWCVTCQELGLKDEMVRCRGCGSWFHTLCTSNVEREGRDDPRLNFWKCTTCANQASEGNDEGEQVIKSYSDVENDKRFEDTDSNIE